MLRQENSSIRNAQAAQSTVQSRHRKLFVAFAGLLVIIIVVSAILITQGNIATQEIENPTDYGSSLPLCLNYVTGEQMFYETKNILKNEMMIDSKNCNLTKTMRIISQNTDGYKAEERVTVMPNLIGNTPSIIVNISKASFYTNFIPEVPSIFYASANPTITAYLTQKSVNVGDTWKIPVNTGNSGLGMTGEVTLKFSAIENITVPAGSYRTMKIEVTSNMIDLHADGTSNIIIPSGMTLQLNGTTYLEQGTCRLIRADLTQVMATTNSHIIGSNSTMYTENTLVEYTKP